MIEIISEIRKKHNNTLSGIPVSQIIKESQELFLQNQRNRTFLLFISLFLIFYLYTIYFDIHEGDYPDN